MTKHQIIKDAIKSYRLIYKEDLKVKPYRKHKKGIRHFMKACKELQKYKPNLRFGEFDTAYSVNDYKNIKRFVIWYDYDDDIEDNEKFYCCLSYKTLPKDHECSNFMDLVNFEDLNNFIKEIFIKEK